MKIKNLFTLLGFIIPFCVQAQELLTQATLQVVPVSPNAASLGIYGAIPVSHYTGTPNISLPLYEINLDGKSFPISLSYHASGIKVGQEASSVGMGWTLNGYGCIVKDVKGWDDFASAYPKGYYFDTDMPIADENNDNDINRNKVGDFLSYQRNEKDGSPDLFHFNFGGYSGTMLFNKINTGFNTKTSARPVIQKNSDNLYLEYDITKSCWKAIDGDGYIYYFNTYETTKYYTTSSNTNFHPSTRKKNDFTFDERNPQPEVITAWYIDSIVSPKKNKIIFEYKKEDISTLVQMQETVYHLIEMYPNQFGGSVSRDIGNYNYSYSKIDQVVIKSIKTDTETIEFTTTDRIDIEPVNSNKKPQRISQITRKDGLGKVRSTFNLSYKYLGDQSKYSTCRLFLTKVEETANGVETIGHEFTYTESPALPDKHSNQIDDWGYYNGKSATGTTWHVANYQYSSGITYIPQMKINPQTYTSPYGKEYNHIYRGRSHEVSDTHMKAGTLHTITYPTGLTTRFEFEPHEVRNGDVTTIEKKTKNVANVTTRNYIHNEDEDDDERPPYAEILQSSFEVTKNKTEIKITCYLNLGEIDRENNEFHFNNFIGIKDEKGSFVKTFSMNWGDMPMKDFYINLDKGKYTLVLRKGYIETTHKYYTNITAWMDVTNTTTIKGKGGGLRIKSIFNEEDNKNVSTFHYIYKLKDSDQSSGLFMENPTFYYTFRTQQSDIYSIHTPTAITLIPVTITAIYAAGQSSPYTPFSYSAMGSPVGYDRVFENHRGADPSRNDRGIEYTFHNYADTPRSGTEIYIPGFPNKPNFQNGLPKTILIQDECEGLMEEVKYTYTKTSSPSLKGLKTYRVPAVLEMLDQEYTALYIKFYDIKIEYWRLTQETTVQHYWLGSNKPTIIKSYAYTAGNSLPTSISTTNSDGTSQRIEYKYSNNLSDAISIKMKANNMVNQKLEVIEKKGSYVIAGEKVEYTETNGMLLPKYYYQLQLTAPVSASSCSSYFKKVYTIDQYNKKGRILQTTDKSGRPTTYIWSYNNRYPIAQIQNASYSTIKNQLGDVEALEKSYSPDMTKFNTLRTTANYLVTTYTYDPLYGKNAETSPSGTKTAYEYDGFGRLITIKDHNNYKIKSFNYNFKK